MTQQRLRKTIMFDTNQYKNEDDDDDDDDQHWYHLRSSSPPSSLSVNNSFTHQSSSATMGSWGFDVNRTINGQTPLSFTSNNNQNIDQHTIKRIAKDYNEHLVDISSSSSPQNFNLRSPTLTKQKNGNEFAAIDRLLLGPNRIIQSDDSVQQQMKSHHSHQTEHELLAWQNRMLEREQRVVPQSPNITRKQHGLNSSTRQTPSSIRPISATSTQSENQSELNESTVKLARVVKRYIELLYHLQTFYERITDELYNGNNILRINQSSQTIFQNHCRKIDEQLQKCKPIWEEKLSNLQNLLKDISSFQWSNLQNETTFLQRRSTLINLFQSLMTQKDLDKTQISIRIDIDRLLQEDKLALQLQDELSTLLQHQSLLNDFTSLLQWNRSIYSPNEQNRVENILPFLREQITTTDSYISHVSQQLTELVMSLRSLEKYILSYTNTIPLIDDVGIVPSQSNNRGRWRPYDETDIDTLKSRESRLLQSQRNGNTHDDGSKKRSTSMPRYVDPEEVRDDLRASTRNTTIHLNINNNNNNGTRLATVKPAKTQPNSILKSHSHTNASSGRRKDFDYETEMFRSNRVDIRDFDNDERLARLKKKQDIRKMVSIQNMHEIHDPDSSDTDSRLRKFEKTIHLQSVLAEEAKEKSRQVSAKHHSNKFHQRQSMYPNA